MPSAFNYSNPGGVSLSGTDSQPPATAVGLALIRAEVGSLNSAAAGLGAPDLATRCLAILTACQGQHANATALISQAATKAQASDAAGARTAIGSAATAVLLAPSMPPAGVFF